MRLRVDYTPHPGQRLFHDSTARNRVLACGARWGKDRACIAESIRLNVELNQLHRPGLVPKVHGWFVTPNYPLARQLWRELKEFTPAQVLAKPPSETDYRLDWRGGAVVEVKSADDPRSLLAVGLDWVVLTEAALLREEAWEMALRPRLASPQRAGLAIFNGTPKGRNRYWDVYLRGQDPVLSRNSSARQSALTAGPRPDSRHKSPFPTCASLCNHGSLSGVSDTGLTRRVTHVLGPERRLWTHRCKAEVTGNGRLRGPLKASHCHLTRARCPIAI